MRTLYYNGVILPMTGESDRAEALLTADGRIEAVGGYAELAPRAQQNVDLGGRALLPGFIDGHSHFSGVANSFTLADLFEVKSFEELGERLLAFAEREQLPPDAILIGRGYDNNLLPDRRHPTRRELDALGLPNPIVITHQSGHMGVLSSAALERVTLPEGGEHMVGRDEHGTLTGYFEESVFTALRAQLVPANTQFDPQRFKRAEQVYFSHGITTAQDGGVAPSALERYRGLHGLAIDLVVYVAAPRHWDEVQADPDFARPDYREHWRVGGYKVVLDGSPQAKTAYMLTPYEDSGDYRGYPLFTQEELDAFTARAKSEERQLLVHCNGSAASEMFLRACEKLGGGLSRPVMVHCQTVEHSQLERMRALDMIPSTFIGHCWYWGDTHLRNFGPERGRRISPLREMHELGLCYNLHQDSPVTPCDMLHSVWCAVQRRTREGVCIGPENRITIYQALEGCTKNAAYAYFEEADKGTLEPGKRADMVILSEDPLACPPERLRELTVCATIKDGVQVFAKE